MKYYLCAAALCLTSLVFGQAPEAISPKAPLKQDIYRELPLGAIKPQGWLREMLVRQKDGATGNLDQLYPLVMGKRNG